MPGFKRGEWRKGPSPLHRHRNREVWECVCDTSLSYLKPACNDTSASRLPAQVQISWPFPLRSFCGSHFGGISFKVNCFLEFCSYSGLSRSGADRFCWVLEGYLPLLWSALRCFLLLCLETFFFRIGCLYLWSSTSPSFLFAASHFLWPGNQITKSLSIPGGGQACGRGL